MKAKLEFLKKLSQDPSWIFAENLGLFQDLRQCRGFSNDWVEEEEEEERPVSGTVHPRLVSATSSLDDGDLGPIRRHPHPPPPPHGHLHPPPHHEPRLVAARPSLGEERPWTWPSNAHATVSAAI